MELSLLIYLWELIHYHHLNFLKIKAAPGQKRTELKDIILPSQKQDKTKKKKEIWVSVRFERQEAAR